jgi:hypothetical protein
VDQTSKSESVKSRLYRGCSNISKFSFLRFLTVWAVSASVNGHLYRVTYTIYRTDTINSPDDGHTAARNM